MMVDLLALDEPGASLRIRRSLWPLFGYRWFVTIAPNPIAPNRSYSGWSRSFGAARRAADRYWSAPGRRLVECAPLDVRPAEYDDILP